MITWLCQERNKILKAVSVAGQETIDKKAIKLVGQPTVMLDVTNSRPNQALDLLRQALPANAARRKQWIADARIAAVLGNCPKSHASFVSGTCVCILFKRKKMLALAGIRNWCEFAEIFFGSSALGFPPTVDAIVCWSHTFRNIGTFANYLGFLRSACLALDVDAPPCDTLIIRRAKGAIVKRQMWTPRYVAACICALAGCSRGSLDRHKLFLQRLIVSNLVLSPGSQAGAFSFSILWLVSYTFLLRVPSEAMPICKCDSSVEHSEEHAALYIEHGRALCLRLKSRKNAPRGCVLKRYCTCSEEYPDHMCPIHVAWDKYFAALESGAKPWAAHSPGYATTRLRSALQELQVHSHLCAPAPAWVCDATQVPNCALYGLHDLRRGHAKVQPFMMCVAAVYLCPWIDRTCSSLGYRYTRSERLEDGEVTPSSGIWMNASLKPISLSRQPWKVRVMNSSINSKRPSSHGRDCLPLL